MTCSDRARTIPRRYRGTYGLRPLNNGGAPAPRHAHAKHHAPAFLAVRLAELQLHAADDLHDRVVVQHLDDPGVGARAYLDRHVLRDQRDQSLELLGEDRGSFRDRRFMSEGRDSFAFSSPSVT